MNTDDKNLEGFTIECQGPIGIWAVFEDDGETGYLYLYEPEGRGVVRHLHLYDRSIKLPVKEADVRVVWSEDFSKCGALVWGRMRGIIRLDSAQEGRIWLENRDSPGISDPEWLEGFTIPHAD